MHRILPLASLQPGERAKIVRITPELEPYLSGFGLYPGVEVYVRQRFPTYVVKCDETEVAIEANVASGVWVRRSG